MSVDPFARLKVVLGYVVTAVWCIVLLAFLFGETPATVVIISAQAIMAAVAGSLYADKWMRKR